MRGAACTWNDNVDQEYDRKVARCRNRPIARGAVSTVQGHIFTAALLVAMVPIFTFLPIECTWHAVPITLLFGAYAFMKRISHYPQLVLGFPFAWAILLSCSALGVDALGSAWQEPTICLFVANVLWTMIYDTVYAHQDVQDDVNAGVKSMAVRFKDSTKTLASTLTVGMVTLLAAAAWLAGLGVLYVMIGCGGSALALGLMISKVDLKNASSCAWFFYRGFWYVGGSIVVGLFGAYLQHWYGMSDKDLITGLL